MVFLNKREFSESVYEQIVEETDFVLRNIRLGAAKSYGLSLPLFEVFNNMFRVTLFRKILSAEEKQRDEEASEKHRRNIGETSEKHRRNIGIMIGMI